MLNRHALLAGLNILTSRVMVPIDMLRFATKPKAAGSSPIRGTRKKVHGGVARDKRAARKARNQLRAKCHAR